MTYMAAAGFKDTFRRLLRGLGNVIRAGADNATNKGNMAGITNSKNGSYDGQMKGVTKLNNQILMPLRHYNRRTAFSFTQFIHLLLFVSHSLLLRWFQHTSISVHYIVPGPGLTEQRISVGRKYFPDHAGSGLNPYICALQSDRDQIVKIRAVREEQLQNVYKRSAQFAFWKYSFIYSDEKPNHTEMPFSVTLLGSVPLCNKTETTFAFENRGPWRFQRTAHVPGSRCSS